jgi:LemA protein
MVVAFVVGVVVVLLVVLFLGTFNGLVRERNHCSNTWAQIEVELKRRHDLVPNLVETVQGYAGHERATLELVTQARSRALGADQSGSRPGLAGAEGMLTGALGRLFALAEAYPDLKADQNFLMLQTQLVSIEDRVSSARQIYNDSMLRYNTRIQTFPRNTFARLLGFTPGEYFEAGPGSTGAVEIQF